MISNPNGIVAPQPMVYYHQPSQIYRKTIRPVKARYQYIVEQDGQAYRKCQWCEQWCTRKCPSLDFCDRILACPLLCCLLAGLFLFLLFVALLTLFGLHPAINPSQRYYGIISKLSIINRTTYVYGLDTLCSATNPLIACLDITTSTDIVANIATTIITNRAFSIMNSSFISFVLLVFCLSIYCLR